jgi:hypothetical protein
MTTFSARPLRSLFQGAKTVSHKRALLKGEKGASLVETKARKEGSTAQTLNCPEGEPNQWSESIDSLKTAQTR